MMTGCARTQPLTTVQAIIKPTSESLNFHEANVSLSRGTTQCISK
jgi:hypothetical protein